MDGELDWFYEEIHYEDADIPDSVNEADLTIYCWDLDQNGWEECENSEVDTVNNIVSANVTHFTIFAPMAEQKDVRGTDEGNGVSVAVIVIGVLVAVFVVVVIISLFARKKKRLLKADETWEEDLPPNEDEVDWDRYQK